MAQRLASGERGPTERGLSLELLDRPGRPTRRATDLLVRWFKSGARYTECRSPPPERRSPSQVGPSKCSPAPMPRPGGEHSVDAADPVVAETSPTGRPL